MRCEKPFFISFFERSGSSFLVRLLANHKDIACFAEIFDVVNPGKNRQRLPQFPDTNSVREKLDSIYTQKQKASGFKFKYPGQDELYPDVYEYLLERAETMSVIFLYRKNLLKAAISKQNQLRLVAMGKPSNLNEKNYVCLEKINLNIEQALRYMAVREQNDKKYYQKIINSFPKKYILAYEELLENESKVMKELYDFLEVENSQSNSETSRRTIKITNDDIEQAVENYQELVEKLQGTKYEKYLTLKAEELPSIDQLLDLG